MGNGKKISPTIFKKISGNHREKDLGGSIYGLARTSFFFLKNPPPQPPRALLSLKIRVLKQTTISSKNRFFPVFYLIRERDLGVPYLGWPKYLFFIKKTTPPAPLGRFKSLNQQLLSSKNSYIHCYTLSGKDRERDLGGSIPGLARTIFFFENDSPPAPFKSYNKQLLSSKNSYFHCYTLSGKDQERDLGGSIPGIARTIFFF